MRAELREGQKVLSKDGHKLGHVVTVGASHFEVTRGFFLPQVNLLELAHVQRVEKDVVHLSLDEAAVNAIWDLQEHYEEPGERRRVAEEVQRRLNHQAEGSTHDPR